MIDAPEKTPTATEMVRRVMSGGKWWTLGSIQRVVNGRFWTHISLPGISARVRDLRKPAYGSYTVERRHVCNGLHEYRLVD